MSEVCAIVEAKIRSDWFLRIEGGVVVDEVRNTSEVNPDYKAFHAGALKAAQAKFIPLRSVNLTWLNEEDDLNLVSDALSWVRALGYEKTQGCILDAIRKADRIDIAPAAYPSSVVFPCQGSLVTGWRDRLKDSVENGTDPDTVVVWEPTIPAAAQDEHFSGLKFSLNALTRAQRENDGSWMIINGPFAFRVMFRQFAAKTLAV